MARGGLGTGLGAIFGDDVLEESRGDTLVPLSKIEPRADQPRTDFDEEALEDLAASIREHGVIQPLTVRQLDGGYYQIIAGERRWRASRLAGLSEVPVRIIEADDRLATELAMVENLQREDLNPMEEARGYRVLMEEYSMTQEQVAERVSKSRPVIANALRLLLLPDEVQRLVAEGRLSMSQARAILAIKSDDGRVAAAKAAADGELTVRQINALAKRLEREGAEKPKKKSRVSADGVDYFAEVERELTRSLGRKVRIAEGKNKGKIELEYYGDDDLETLCDLLRTLEKAGGRRE